MCTVSAMSAVGRIFKGGLVDRVRHIRVSVSRVRGGDCFGRLFLGTMLCKVSRVAKLNISCGHCELCGGRVCTGGGGMAVRRTVRYKLSFIPRRGCILFSVAPAICFVSGSRVGGRVGRRCSRRCLSGVEGRRCRGGLRR